MVMQQIMINTKAALYKLKREGAITWEGLELSDENLNYLFDWIRDYTPFKREAIYIIHGALMNQFFDLTGEDAYPEDLNIVSIRLKDLVDPSAISVSWLMIDGQFLDWIIAKNKCYQREARKRLRTTRG